jgi:hypothetical protein
MKMTELITTHSPELHTGIKYLPCCFSLSIAEWSGMDLLLTENINDRKCTTPPLKGS